MYSPKQIEQRLARLREIETLLHDPAVNSDPAKLRALGKELRDLQKVRELHDELTRIDAHSKEAEHLLRDAATDPEMKKMALAEAEDMKGRREKAVKGLEGLLVKKDPILTKNAIIEIRAGTGGAEASLFAAEIFRMYVKYAANVGYKVEVLTQSTTESGGLREVVFMVQGEGVFGRFRFESGVHRVQRVPVTEASGRIHTSAVTVAVLPEAEEIEINIKPEELRVEVFRSGGPGGQSVNTTDSAVRVTHIPSGLVVKCQDEKSQLKNKAKAMKILSARLFDLYQQQSTQKMAEARKAQIGSGDRSEKIRTYNFPERRVTDHRIGLTLHTLDRVMEGELGPVIEALQQRAAQAQIESEENA